MMCEGLSLVTQSNVLLYLLQRESCKCFACYYHLMIDQETIIATPFSTHSSCFFSVGIFLLIRM